jgi:hypothetical protein
MRRFNLPVYIPDFVYWLGLRILLLYRRIRYGYSFRKIPLTQEKFAIVDEIDYEKLSKSKWHTLKVGQSFYAVRSQKKGGKYLYISLHRQIIDAPADKVVDHINHNGLDNRRANLRIVSPQQNIWNSRKHHGKHSSKYKGVTKSYGKWQASINCKKKCYALGVYDDEESAAKAYDAKAKELFGEYACLNFPDAAK